MRLQVKIMWVGTPTQNQTTTGMFYNQDVVAQDLNSNDSFVLRVTSGQRANNISNFHICQGEVMEVNGYFNTSFGKEGRPFMQFNCTAVERDKALWGTTGGGNSQLDLSKLPPSYNRYSNPAPQAPTYTQQAPQGVVVPQPPQGMAAPQANQGGVPF